jgi:hypothetical protein
MPQLLMSWIASSCDEFAGIRQLSLLLVLEGLKKIMTAPKDCRESSQEGSGRGTRCSRIESTLHGQ